MNIIEMLTTVSGGALRTLLIINHIKGKNKTAMVTITGVVKHSKGKISRPTVRRAFDELENIGAIRIIGKEGHTRLIESMDLYDGFNA